MRMNLRILAVAAAPLVGLALFAWACGEPNLVIPPQGASEASAADAAPCSDATSMAIRANTGAQGNLEPFVPCGNGDKVVVLDPSEGLCDAAFGYLVCMGKCYSEFKCEIPAGYTLVELDGASIGDGAARDAEAGTDEKAADGGDGGFDAKSDAAPASDAPVDAPTG